MKNLNFIILLLGLLFTACQQDFETEQEQIDQNNLKKEALWMIKSVDKKVSTRAVAIRGKLWQPGDTIRIKFLNDPYNLEEQVKQTAAKWLKYINLYFKYVGTNEEADVKIGFSDDRYISWSTIGTDCREIAQDSVSLNFSGFGDNLLYEPELITSDILRGFGHVLGLGFEYKNPLSTIEFYEDVTDEDIYDEYRLSPEEIKEFRQLYDSSQTNYTSYDRFSIMCIDIPRALVPRPQATHYNTEFSGNDTTFIAELYPYSMIEDTIMPIVFMRTNKQDISISCILTQEIKVDWGDGSVETLNFTMGSAEHTFKNKYETHAIILYGRPTSITYFHCMRNKIDSLDISKNINLTYLDANENELYSLDVSKNLNLEHLGCTVNLLMDLDVSKNVKLKFLNCGHNYALHNLNVSNNIVLKELYCYITSLSRIDLRDCISLETFSCYNSQLTALDVTYNLLLRSIDCNNNPFFRKGNNELLNFVNSLPDRTGKEKGYLSGLPDLFSIIELKNWDY